jgi:protein-S-isoprenylcysteine O-methyltransferase Ste14
MEQERIPMDEFEEKTWWTSARRAWLYKIVVALVPLLVAVGVVTQDIAGLILNVVAALLAVGAGGMALTNVTPDNVFKIAVEVEEEDEEVA